MIHEIIKQSNEAKCWEFESLFGVVFYLFTLSVKKFDNMALLQVPATFQINGILSFMFFLESQFL